MGAKTILFTLKVIIEIIIKFFYFFILETSANESFVSIKNSAQKEKRFEKVKPNTLTKSVDIDRESLRSNKLNFNTVRNTDTSHYNVNLYNVIN